MRPSPRFVGLRRERLAFARAILIAVLGGVCAWCGSDDHPEVDHVDGRDWVPRELSATARLQRYFAEFRAGVRLRVLCKRCNSKDGRRRQLAADLVEAIECDERAA